MSESMEIFKSEDFEGPILVQQYYEGKRVGKKNMGYFEDVKAQWIAATANAKVREWLERQPVVYGAKEKPVDGGPYRMIWDECSSLDLDTHSARLVCIEPIVKESEERKLLRELADCPAWEDPFNDLKERARKLLGETTNLIPPDEWSPEPRKPE